MKYCAKCGHELVDEAVVCTNCGCPVTANIPVAIPAAPVAAPMVNPTVSQDTPSKKGTICRVFNLVFDIFAALTVFFLILSVAVYPYLSTYVSHNYAYDYYGNFFSSTSSILSSILSDTHNHSVSVYFYPNFTYSLLGFIASLLSVASGITSFIVALIKGKTSDKVFPAISRFVISLLLGILALLVFLSSL